MAYTCSLYCDTCGETYATVTDCIEDLSNLAQADGWLEAEGEHRCPGCSAPGVPSSRTEIGHAVQL